MRISLIQTDIVWADKGENLERTEQTLNTLAGHTDLVVLPEMFTTGFCTDRLDLAETMNGETVRRLKSWAACYRMAITGSFIVRENDNVFNRAFFLFPDGKLQTADKRHLFSVGGEHRYFSPGNERLLVGYRGVNICVLICYDIRFPVWARNRNNEYDLLIFTANFPHARMDAWDVLLKARAVENQAYVCGVNRIGVDGQNITYSGHSVLIDFKGHTMVDFAEHESGVRTCEIAKTPLDAYRQKYAFWKDADRFELR